MNTEAVIRDNFTTVYRLSAVLAKNTEACGSVCRDAFLKFAGMKNIPADSRAARDELIRKTVSSSKNILAVFPTRKNDDISAAISDKELSAAYYGMQLLPKNNRAALHLHMAEGMSAEEIAKTLRIKPADAKHRLDAGSEMLEQILKRKISAEEYIKANEYIVPDEMLIEHIISDCNNGAFPESSKRLIILIIAAALIAAAATGTAIAVKHHGGNDAPATSEEASPLPEPTPEWVVDDNGDRGIATSEEPVMESAAPTEAPTSAPTPPPTAKPTPKPTQKPVQKPQDASDETPQGTVTQVMDIIDERPATSVPDRGAVEMTEELQRSFPKLSGFIYSELIENGAKITCVYKGDGSKTAELEKSAPKIHDTDVSEINELDGVDVTFEDKSTDTVPVFRAEFNLYDSGYALTVTDCGKDEFLATLNELLEKLQS